MDQYPVLSDSLHDGILADIVENIRSNYVLYRFVWLFPDEMCFQSGRPFQASLLVLFADQKQDELVRVISVIGGKPTGLPLELDTLIGRSNLVRTKAVEHKGKKYANVAGISRPRKIFQAVSFGFVRSKDRRK